MNNLIDLLTVDPRVLVPALVVVGGIMTIVPNVWRWSTVLRIVGFFLALEMGARTAQWLS